MALEGSRGAGSASDGKGVPSSSSLAPDSPGSPQIRKAKAGKNNDNQLSPGQFCRVDSASTIGGAPKKTKSLAFQNSDELCKLLGVTKAEQQEAYANEVLRAESKKASELKIAMETTPDKQDAILKDIREKKAKADADPASLEPDLADLFGSQNSVRHELESVDDNPPDVNDRTKKCKNG